MTVLPISRMKYRKLVLKDSPLVYLRMGETSGTTCYDVSGNARDGTLNGGYTQGATGRKNNQKAITFNGTTGYCNLGNPSSVFSITGNCTFEAWVRPTDVSSLRCIFCKGNGEDIVLDINGTQARFTLKRASGWVTVTTGGLAALVSGNWYHIVGTWDGTTCAVYLNGVVGYTSTSGSGAIQTSVSNLFAGARPGNDRFWQGDIDDVAVYATALSAARILEHYKAGLEILT